VILSTDLTGEGDQSDRSELRFCSCFVSCGVSHALVKGELACVQGELFVLFELRIGGLCSLLEHNFVSDVSSRCPCLRGLRLDFFK
jgi:hypothetical protein